MTFPVNLAFSHPWYISPYKLSGNHDNLIIIIVFYLNFYHRMARGGRQPRRPAAGHAHLADGAQEMRQALQGQIPLSRRQVCAGRSRQEIWTMPASVPRHWFHPPAEAMTYIVILILNWLCPSCITSHDLSYYFQNWKWLELIWNDSFSFEFTWAHLKRLRI